MKAQRYGRIINMASVNGLVGFAGYIIYLAGEQAKGIIGQAIVIDGGYTAQ